MNPIVLDARYALALGIGAEHGVHDSEVYSDSNMQSLRSAIEKAVRQKDVGETFWSLPFAPPDENLVEYCKRLREHVSDVLVLGTGGSSLGGQALIAAFATAPETPIAPGAPAVSPRLHFVDNSDPWKLRHWLQTLDPRRTGALLISKSGTTLETVAQWLIVEPWLQSGGTDLTQRVVVITDPSTGPMRKLARERGWMNLPIPPTVGGRFSVLTAVGLLPGFLAGVDPEEILAGAREVYACALQTSLRLNPVAEFALLHVAHHRLRSRPVHVLMPYTDRLRSFAAWYAQLWAESLGKRFNTSGDLVEQGPTPLAAVGATDQHSQLQLFMEGPRDKLLTFVRIEKPEADLPVPHLAPDSVFAESKLEKLGGSTLHAILNAQLAATAQALAEEHRPSLTLTVPKLDGYHLGALFAWYQAATAFAGELYKINPFDQPGVEKGKVITFSLL